MIDHDLGFHLNGLGAGFHKGFQLLLRLGGIEQRVVLHRLLHFVVAFVSGVLLQHVEDEFFLDCLLHGIQVEGVELAVSSLAAKLFQRGRLWRGSERKVAGVLAHLALVHRRQNLVLHIHRLGTVLASQSFIDLVSSHTRLGRVCLVDDDGEFAVRQLPDAIHDERELLHRGDDDPLAKLKVVFQLLRTLAVRNDVLGFGEQLDVVLELGVEHAPVCHHHHGIKQIRGARGVILLHQLICQPCDGVGLTRACRMLNQVGLAHPFLLGIRQNAAHHVELVIAGEEQCLPLLSGLFVLLNRELGELLNDVGQAAARENVLPQVRRLVPVRIDRVALPVFEAFVERQKVAVIARQLGAHESFVWVYREMHQAAAKLKQRLLGVAVGTVLTNGVLGFLVCPRVFEFQRRHRQAVDEQCHVHRLEGVRLAVMHLPGHAEAVGLEVGYHLGV